MNFPCSSLTAKYAVRVTIMTALIHVWSTSQSILMRPTRSSRFVTWRHVGKPTLNKVSLPRRRVYGVKNRIAVLKQQVAADSRYLHMRREGALLIVEDQLHGLRHSFSVERVEHKNSVSQTTVSSDEQSFIRHLGAAQ